MPTVKTKKIYLIKVSDYGSFLYRGTREQAERRAKDKAEWEGASYTVKDVTATAEIVAQEMVSMFQEWMNSNPTSCGKKGAQKLGSQLATIDDVHRFMLNEKDIADEG
jgi:hypothetical protein